MKPEVLSAVIYLAIIQHFTEEIFRCLEMENILPFHCVPWDERLHYNLAKQVLKLPEQWTVQAMFALGKPASMPSVIAEKEVKSSRTDLSHIYSIKAQRL